MRGSPIRKSSDQRSVDSSPRLIAASYVLHRLLVPRHPPCALNNLTTQKTHPAPPEGNTKRVPTRTLFYRVRRCSRPLCSSQRTTRHHPSVPARPTHTHRRHSGTRSRTAPTRSNSPPGNTARARSLRTQQRAYNQTLTHHTRSTPRRAVLTATDDAGRTGQRSTLELHPARTPATRE